MALTKMVNGTNNRENGDGCYEDLSGNGGGENVLIVDDTKYNDGKNDGNGNISS